ncbi:MAG TPA: GntR family transcriptional regulator [Chloroflexi bacterium]|jgi:DNA-binding GntR family transcriptional regulator|nr:GntR family transcriptional regulator [Chloroflexota bacterium]
MRRAPMIVRNVLSDQVKDYLLTAILAGEFPPGSRIIETRVARHLGVSQGPVREALRDLEALGLIDTTPYQGARVRQPHKAELLEAYDLRAVLESFGARLAMPRLSDADLLDLEGFVSAMQEAARAGDENEQARVDVAFHSRIVALSGNQVLQRLWRFLEPVSRTHITYILPGVDADRISGLHVPILAALRARDAVSAEQAIHDHFTVVGSMFDNLFVEQSAVWPAPRASGQGRTEGAANGALP